MMFKFPTALLFFALGASAAPTLRSVNLSQRDVWAPPVTSPDASTVWTIGSNVTVTWDTSTRPVNVTNPIGTLLLGYLLPSGEGGENLDDANPLTKGFPLDDGSVSFVVPIPPSTPDNTYIVALIGDSGNISPKFQIID